MKVQLTLIDRITALDLLPAKEDFFSIRTMSELKKKLSLTEKELTDYEVSAANGMMKWNEKGVKSKIAIDFTTIEIDFIKVGLKAKSIAKEFTEQMLPLSEKLGIDETYFK